MGEVPLADNAMTYLQLLPADRLPKNSRQEERDVLARDLSPEAAQQKHERREAFYNPPAKEVLVKTLAANPLPLSEEMHRKYLPLAMFMQQRHAPLLDLDVVLFLLVSMIEHQSPFKGWFTRYSERIMHSLNMDEEEFERVVGLFMGGKASAFLGEGLAGAFEGGFSVEGLVSSLSYAFTWTHLTPEGSLETLFGTVGSNLPWVTALVPLFTALAFANMMLNHAKRSVDKIVTLRMAARAATVEDTVVSPQRFGALLLRVLQTRVLPGYLDDFDSHPLGLPEGDTPLVTHVPANEKVQNASSIRFAQTDGVSGTLVVDEKQYFVAFVSGVEGEWEFTDAELELLDGWLTITGRSGTLRRQRVQLMFLVDGPLTRDARQKQVANFVSRCETVSGVTGGSRLGVALRVALVALLARATDLVSCPSTDAERVVECLLKGEDGLPVFEATVFPRGLSDVQRAFCVGTARRG